MCLSDVWKLGGSNRHLRQAANRYAAPEEDTTT